MSFTTRAIVRKDIENILEAEAMTNRYMDPDFEIETLAPWAHDYDSLEALLSQTRPRTRGYVIHKERPDYVSQFCGAIVFEIEQNIHIAYIVVHPEGHPDTLEALIDFAEKKAGHRKLSIAVREDDIERMKYFGQLGWSPKIQQADEGCDMVVYSSRS